ncbi:MAG: hypothetical protein Q8P48_10300 [Deltaproteobacteria bacterium]|nr:hypothetical protein [Deltaproteobacteria bacterium]
MGHEGGRHSAILEEVRSISLEQKGLFSENRLEDLLRCQRRREVLLTELSGLNGRVDYKKEPYRTIIKDIVELDKVLALGIESSKNEVGLKLKKIRSGVKALKAYAG